MCVPIFVVIGHCLEVAQTRDSFSILHNFGENNIRACVHDERYSKTELGWIK